MNVILKDKIDPTVRRAEDKGVSTRPITPQSNLPSSSSGVSVSSIQTLPDRCGRPRSGRGGCWLKAGHSTPCP